MLRVRALLPTRCVRPEPAKTCPKALQTLLFVTLISLCILLVASRAVNCSAVRAVATETEALSKSYIWKLRTGNLVL